MLNKLEEEFGDFDIFMNEDFEDITIFTINWVKWYPNYKEVQAIENLVDEIDGAIIAEGEDMAISQHNVGTFHEKTGYVIDTYVETHIYRD
jgi:uncharacterized protein (DUF1015 family)